MHYQERSLNKELYQTKFLFHCIPGEPKNKKRNNAQELEEVFILISLEQGRTDDLKQRQAVYTAILINDNFEFKRVSRSTLLFSHSSAAAPESPKIEKRNWGLTNRSNLQQYNTAVIT